jgi:hypothetical protein
MRGMLQGLKPTFSIPFTPGLKPRPPKEPFMRKLLETDRDSQDGTGNLRGMENT